MYYNLKTVVLHNILVYYMEVTTEEESIGKKANSFCRIDFGTRMKLRKLMKYNESYQDVVLQLLDVYYNSVKLSPTIQERLKQFANEGDTTEDIIRRLIDIYEIDKDQRKIQNIITEEDLEKQGIFVKDIVGIEGRSLIIEKQNGTWTYKIKDEVSDEILTLLEQRKKEKWQVLGLALFKQLNGKLLSLVEIRL